MICQWFYYVFGLMNMVMRIDLGLK